LQPHFAGPRVVLHQREPDNSSWKSLTRLRYYPNRRRG